jgi:hypothetical protein
MWLPLQPSAATVAFARPMTSAAVSGPGFRPFAAL